jgi:hypothetical protein
VFCMALLILLIPVVYRISWEIAQYEENQSSILPAA